MMKRIVLLVILFKSFGLMAQRYYPAAVSRPATGFMQLLQDNRYVLSLTIDQGEWAPSMRYISEKSPNTDYIGLDIGSSWVDGTWADRSVTTDSFVLDNQNRLWMVYNKDILDYPGLKQKTKAKYVYSYNTANQLEHIAYHQAVNFNSNNYIKTSESYYTYDLNGKRTLDSSIYYYNGGEQTTLSYYTYTGDKLHSIIELNGADTGQIIYYTFNGELLSSATITQFDADADEWTITQADTFEYNSMNQIIRHSSLGAIYKNGVVTIEPTGNDLYTYTSDGQLQEEIARQWVNGTWINHTKTLITYNANNKPIEGYEYVYVINDWATAPRTKYLFTVQTGLNTKSNPLSEVVIAPNPANEILTIDLDTYETSVTLYDITGKSVYSQTGLTGKHTIDVSSLNNGLYDAFIQSEGFQRTAKVMIKH